MNQVWKAFLKEQGATFVEKTVDESCLSILKDFGDPEAETRLSASDTIFSTSSDYALIEVKGEDAESFLQNQLTNDIRNVTESSHQQSAWCNPKGRIIANFRIFKRDDAYYLSVSADLVERVLKKLRMYVMMSKVVLEDVTDNYAWVTLAGDNAEPKLAEFLQINLDSLSENADNAIHDESLSLLRVKGKLPRFDIMAEVETAKTLWEKCKTLAKPVSGVGINYLNIISGIPVISAASSEAWIPQMVNYIQIGGVDFQKGCYPGQEVVARLNYLGKTKRRMYLVDINASAPVSTGDVIKNNADKEAGKILNAVQIDTKSVKALAVLKIAAVEQGSLTLAENNAEISVLELPYTVEEQ